MNIGTVSKDRKQVYMVEVRLCVHCCRMFALNLEQYQQIYMADYKGLLFAHVKCKPTKNYEDISWKKLK